MLRDLNKWVKRWRADRKQPNQTFQPTPATSYYGDSGTATTFTSFVNTMPVNVGTINQLTTDDTMKMAESKKPPSRRGTIPWNYRGPTLLKDSIRRSFEYKQWRDGIYRRDDFTCQRCDVRGGKLHAHHKKRFSVILRQYNITAVDQALKCVELWDINNGVTLCISCHRGLHTEMLVVNV